jgi:hypothetical protein
MRIEPNMPAHLYQTYSITAPTDTTIVAACEQVACAAWRNGWDSVIDESTELGQQQAAYIRGQSRRTFREQKRGDGLTVFRFEAHQRCFEEHRTRPEIYLVRDGDHRGNPTGRKRQHTRPADWVEDMAENQGHLIDLRERG